MKIPSPKLRVSQISVARVYNRGNYENSRYELTIDVPEGASPAKAMQTGLGILFALNPRPPVPRIDYDQAVDFLKDPEAWAKNIEDPKARRKLLKERAPQYRRTVRAYEKFLARRLKAVRALEAMGGTAKETDHKLSWEPDEWD